MKDVKWTIGTASIFLAGILIFVGCEDAGSGPGQADAPADTCPNAPQPTCETPDISGNWTMHRMPGTIESEDVCTLALSQNENDVVGSSPDGMFSSIYWPGTIRGTVTGTNVTFQWTYWSAGPTYSLEGTIGEDDEGAPLMEGTWTDGSGASGEWEAEAEQTSALSYL